MNYLYPVAILGLAAFGVGAWVSLGDDQGLPYIICFIIAGMWLVISAWRDDMRRRARARQLMEVLRAGRLKYHKRDPGDGP